MISLNDNVSKYINLLKTKGDELETSKFIKNMKKYQYHDFITGMYNYKMILYDHNLHLGILLTKLESEGHVKEIIKIMYSNIAKYLQYQSSDNMNQYELDESYTKSYSLSEYYNHVINNINSHYQTNNACYDFYLMYPISKLCNEFVKMMNDNSWQYNISFIASFIYFNSLIFTHINEMINASKCNKKILLPESSSNATKLLHLLENEIDDTQIIKAINDTFEKMINYLNETSDIVFIAPSHRL